MAHRGQVRRIDKITPFKSGTKLSALCVYFIYFADLIGLEFQPCGQEYLISLKFRPIAENKVVVKRLVYALTDELRTDYQQCMEQAAAWSKYVIPAYSF